MEIQWPLTFFSVLAGCGGVMFALVGLSEVLKNVKSVRVPAAIVSLVLCVVGGCCSVLHLAQKANIMAAAANIFSFSAISMELIFIGLVCILCVIYLLLVRVENYSGAKIVAIIGIVAGLLLAFITGNGYRMESQPNWNTITLALGYLGTDLAAGAAAFLAVCAFKKVEADELKLYGLVGAVCAAVSLVFVFAYNLVVGFAANPALFWIGCVIAAGIVPLAAGLMCWKGKIAEANLTGILCANAVITLVGAACFRIVMWLLGTGWLDLFSAAASVTLL